MTNYVALEQKDQTMSEVFEIPLSEVVYREDLYPRVKPDAATIQRYAENLETLPPIELNQNHILIDGFHRWTAHRKAEAPMIRAVFTETASEAEAHYQSCLRHDFNKRNSTTLWQSIQQIGIDANSDDAKTLLIQQPLLVERALLDIIGAMPTRPNTKGIDGIFADGATVEVKTSKLSRWENLSSVADYLLLIGIHGASVCCAYFGARERLIALCSQPGIYGAQTRIDARRKPPKRCTPFSSSRSVLAHCTVDLLAIKEQYAI